MIVGMLKYKVAQAFVSYVKCLHLLIEAVSFRQSEDITPPTPAPPHKKPRQELQYSYKNDSKLLT